MFGTVPDDLLDGADDRYDSFFPRSMVPIYAKVRGNDHFANFQWGLTPIWAKTRSTLLTNTQSEDVLIKPTWSESFRRRRCLLPATSFFEPAEVNGKKYQIEFWMKDALPFAFAGVWQKSEAFGEKQNCCSILTCKPNSLVGEVHHRMPVIIRAEHYQTYLSTPPEQAEQLLDMLIPYNALEMEGNFDNSAAAKS